MIYKFKIGIAVWCCSLVYACGVKPPASTSQNTDNAKSKYQPIVYEEPNLTDSHLYKAMNHKFNAQYHEAISELQSFIKLNPKEPAGYYQLAKLQMEQFSNVNESLKNSKAAFQLDNDNKWYRMLYADNLAYSGEFIKGAKLYANLTDAKDYQRDYYIKQLIFYERAKSYSKMIEVIDAMDTYTNEEDEVLDAMRLEVYKLQQDKKNIEIVLKKMADANPDDYTKKLQLAEFYQSTKQIEKADSIYSTFQYEGNDDEGKVAYVYALIQRQDTSNLRKQIDAAYVGNKDTADIMILQNALAMSAEQYPYIVKFYVSVLTDISANDQAHFYAPEFLMGYYSLVRNTDSTGKYAVRSFELGSEDVSIFGSIIGYFLGNKKYDELINTADNAVGSIDSFSIGYYGKALAYMYKEDDAAILRNLDLALQYANVGYVATYKSDIYALKGDAYHRMKQFVLSDKAYDTALYFNPRNATALNNYAYYLSERDERLKAASEMSEKSLTIEENQPSYLDTYGWIQYKLGNYEEAKKYIRKAIEVSPSPSAELWEHLGDVEIKLGNTVKAVDYWKIALEAGGDIDDLNIKIRAHE